MPLPSDWFWPLSAVLVELALGIPCFGSHSSLFTVWKCQALAFSDTRYPHSTCNLFRFPCYLKRRHRHNVSSFTMKHLSFGWHLLDNLFSSANEMGNIFLETFNLMVLRKEVFPISKGIFCLAWLRLDTLITPSCFLSFTLSFIFWMIIGQINQMPFGHLGGGKGFGKIVWKAIEMATHLLQ